MSLENEYNKCWIISYVVSCTFNTILVIYEQAAIFDCLLLAYYCSVYKKYARPTNQSNNNIEFKSLIIFNVF